MSADYRDVTEISGEDASRQQLDMLLTRYSFALPYCDGKDVLEVACGGGLGLGYLVRKARRLVGGDATFYLLECAKKLYQGNIPLLCMDAQDLPFSSKSFDVIIMYEAIYYLPEPEKFIQECQRILREKGKILICSANKEWTDFNPSPLSVNYFSINELKALLSKNGFQVESYIGFLQDKSTIPAQLLSYIKRSAVRFGWMPKTMKSKRFLKRIFHGRLSPLPAVLDEDTGQYTEPKLLADRDRTQDYRVLYWVAESLVR